MPFIVYGVPLGLMDEQLLKKIRKLSLPNVINQSTYNNMET